VPGRKKDEEESDGFEIDFSGEQKIVNLCSNNRVSVKTTYQ